MNKVNWQKETDRLIAENEGKRPRLLLHVCCAPCASASIEYLVKYFDIDLFFYNPNISNFEEYEKRLMELERFVAECGFAKGLKIISREYVHGEFTEKAHGLEDAPEGGGRCAECFFLRLAETVRTADLGEYKYFATTLTISPLKNADRINNMGLDIAKNTKTQYLPTDLKKQGRYIRSIELSKEYGLYRQNFCGCEFSKKNCYR